MESFFDFIVTADGVSLETEDETFVTILHEFVGRPLQLQVYSVKTGLVRDVVVVPSETWGGAGLLGISIRFCPYEKADELVWHVLDVQPGSPAASAGLISNLDYIVGARDAIFYTETCLFKLLDLHPRRPVSLYVYNSVADDVRTVSLTPTPGWAGAGIKCGSLGCSIAFGVGHRIDFVSAAARKRELASSSSSSLPGRPKSVFPSAAGKRSRATEHTELSRLPDAKQYDRGEDLEPESTDDEDDLPPAAMSTKSVSMGSGAGRSFRSSDPRVASPATVGGGMTRPSSRGPESQRLLVDYAYEYRVAGQPVSIPDDLVPYRDNPRLFLESQ